MRRTTATCCASFWPKTARSGRAASEQLGDDGRDPREVLGPRRALEAAARAVHRDGRGEPGRVDLVGAGGEEERDAALARQGEVALLVAGIARQVLAGRELGRVDEERHHDGVAVARGEVDEGEVTLVERPHRGDECDASPVGAQGGDGAAQIDDRAHDVHGEPPSGACSNSR